MSDRHQAQQQKQQQKQQQQLQLQAAARAPAAATAALAGSGAGGAAGLHEACGAEEALLLLALQVAQAPAGAALLVDQGVPALTLALTKWLQAPPPGGDLMGAAPPPAGPPFSHAWPGGGAEVDYSGAYLPDGSPSPLHRLWCSTLALTGLLLGALPGSPAAAGAALQAAVAAEPRLLLAVEPGEGTGAQPVTLGMAQEAQYALCLLCGLARGAGAWRAALPHSLPAFRRASAELLAFLAELQGVHCAPVSPAERAAARVAGAPEAAALGEGWFGACAAGECAAVAGASPAGSFSWQLAERLYSCMHYALAFQLATAPEVSEAEAPELGPEWAAPGALRALRAQCLEVAAAACAPRAAGHPAVRRVLRSVGAALRAAQQLLELRCGGEGRAAAGEVAAALERIEAALKN
jgi:hypothetical protein